MKEWPTNKLVREIEEFLEEYALQEKPNNPENDWAPKRIWLQREQGDEGSHTWADNQIGGGPIGGTFDEAEYVLVRVIKGDDDET